jgi:hypothetical protein
MYKRFNDGMLMNYAEAVNKTGSGYLLSQWLLEKRIFRIQKGVYSDSSSVDAFTLFSFAHPGAIYRMLSFADYSGKKIDLLANSNEQILAEKCLSILCHGIKSTRYKGFADMVYLAASSGFNAKKIQEILRQKWPAVSLR